MPFSIDIMVIHSVVHKSLCFSFTWNNPSEETYEFLKVLGKSEGVSELIYQLEKGEKRSFRVAGPFRVFCEDLLNLKFEVNGEQVARVKEEGEGNYRFDLVK